MPESDTPARRYTLQLLELARLKSTGHGEGDAADTLRVELADVWWELDSDHQEWVREISRDLFLLENDEVFEAISDPESARRLAQEFVESVQRGDWRQVLCLLRSRPAEASPARVAEARAIAYGELGEWEVALAFTEYWLALEPQNSGARYQLIYALSRLKRINEALDRARDFAVVHASDLYWLLEYLAAVTSTSLPQRSATHHYSRIIGELQRLLGSSALKADASPELLAYGYFGLGLALDALGRSKPASEAWARVLLIGSFAPAANELVSIVRQQVGGELRRPDTSRPIGFQQFARERTKPLECESGIQIYLPLRTAA